MARNVNLRTKDTRQGVLAGKGGGIRVSGWGHWFWWGRGEGASVDGGWGAGGGGRG